MSPLVLAIETATGEAAAALADDSGALAWTAVARGRRHVEAIHPAIDFVCRQTQVELRALDAIVVDIGPGLFTGLRAGVTAANALGFALGLPVIGMTSLQVLAEAARRLGLEALPVVDMRRGEIAWAFSGDGDAPSLGTPAELAAELASAELSSPGAGGVLPTLVGDGAVRYRQELVELSGRDLRVAAGLQFPPAAVLAELGVGALVAGAGSVGGAPNQVMPMYMREADVAINWQTRQSRASLGGAAR